MDKGRRLTGGRVEAGRRWAVAVRLADGSRLYYVRDEVHVDAAGRPVETWGRQSQAFAFLSEREAAAASRMQTNRDAKEYLVLRIPYRSPGKAKAVPSRQA